MAFYIITGTVVVMSYIMLRNKLQNENSIEYKKRVVNRLNEISGNLIAEYDPESPKYWADTKSVKEVLDHIHEEVEPYKDNITDAGDAFEGVPLSSKKEELSRLITLIQSDPFIPRELRGELLDFYETRRDVMSSVYMDEISAYLEGLKNGKYWDTLESNHYWLHNQILYKLTERGWNVSQIEEKVHKLRDSIQDYLISGTK